MPSWIYGLSWTYDLPIGREATGIVGALISHWNFAGSLRYASGLPLTITVGNNLSPLGYGTKFATRVQGVDVYKDRNFENPATDRYLNAAAFTTPAAFAFGDAVGPLDYVRGFAQKSEAFSFSKRFKLADHAGRWRRHHQPVQLRPLEQSKHQPLGRCGVRIGDRLGRRPDRAAQPVLSVLIGAARCFAPGC